MILVLTLSKSDAFLTQTHKTNSLKLETLYDIKPQKNIFKYLDFHTLIERGKNSKNQENNTISRGMVYLAEFEYKDCPTKPC